MSKCISFHGEYSDHEFTPEQGEFICARCYVLDEDAALAEVERLRQWKAEARAVFESIDREGLARLIAEVDISWHAMRGLDGQEQYDITLADAVIAHLTRGDQS